MERLIHDLLEVKRVEAGLLQLDLQALRPATLVSGALEMLAPIADGKSIRVRAHVRSTLPLVFADGGRIVQALSNLIGNAVKFTESGGRVAVRAESRRHEVVFSVTDTGPGIEADELEHIFDRFWQARRHRGSDRGLGLGLAIVKGIVQAHGGRVWAESEPGLGTTIRFTLPVATDSSTQAA
jgi:signal transduction histidine kinase